MFSLKQFLLSIGKKIPILEMTAVLLIGQCLIAPIVEYNYYGQFGFNQMKVNQELYLAYAFPAILAIYIGLFLPLGKRKYNQKKLLAQIKLNKRKNIITGSILIAIGMFFEYIVVYLPIPNVAFLFLTFAQFRFVGIFFLWFSDSKYTLPAIILVFLPLSISVITGGVFIELIVWLFFLYCLIAIKRKLSTFTTASIFAVSFVLLSVLQLIKNEYRQLTWNSDNQTESNISVFADLFSKQLNSFNEDIFVVATYAINVRANQGSLLAYELNHIPKKEDIVYGKYFIQEFFGLLLPRFLYPNKPVVPDREKFRRFTGIQLKGEVSMTVGIMGDGYGNFGYWGGIVFCFLIGLFFNFVLRKTLQFSLVYKTLPLWIPIIFFYTIRAGNDFYGITNWMVKVSIIVALFYFVTNNASVKRLLKPQFKTLHVSS